MRTLNHPVEPEELMAYLDGELPLDRAAAAATHLERCPDCQALAFGWRRAGHTMAAWQVEPASVSLNGRISAALDQRKAGGRPVRRLSLWALCAAAALIALVAVVNPKRPHQAASRAMPTPLESQMIQIDGQPMGDALARQPADAVRDQSVQYGLRLAARIPLPAPPPPPSPESSPTGPMIVRTARLTLSTVQFDRARASLEAILKQHLGYYGDLNVSAPEHAGRTLQTTLRIPSSGLEAAIAEIKKLGRTEDETQRGEEVTAQYVDVEARLTNARNTEQRLTALLRDRTGKLSDVLSVEVAIDRTRGEIERMEAERKNLTNRVSFATLTVTITEGYKASTSGKFQAAAAEGYRMMADSCVNAVLLIITYAPSLLFWGVLLGVFSLALWKTVRSRVR